MPSSPRSSEVWWATWIIAVACYLRVIKTQRRVAIARKHAVVMSKNDRRRRRTVSRPEMVSSCEADILFGIDIRGQTSDGTTGDWGIGLIIRLSDKTIGLSCLGGCLIQCADHMNR